MTRTFQQVLFTPQTEWVVPEELKDLRGHKEIAVIQVKYSSQIFP
jgi:hypothetical protein